MEHKNRLAQLRGDMPQKEFAERIGLSQQNYWKYENGKQGMRSDLIETVCREFECSAEWLLCLDDISTRARTVTSDEEAFAEVPLLGSIAAGKPIEMDAVENSFPIPRNVYDDNPGCFLLKIEGNSMNRILLDGYYALIRPCDEVTIDNAPYAVCVNGYDATVKRVRKLANGFELVPDSTDPTYRTKVYDYGEEGTETITIIGRVVWHCVPYGWTY